MPRSGSRTRTGLTEMSTSTVVVSSTTIPAAQTTAVMANAKDRAP